MILKYLEKADQEPEEKKQEELKVTTCHLFRKMKSNLM